MRSLYNNRWFALLVALLLVANIVTLIMLWGNKRHTDEMNKPAAVPPGPAVEYLTRELQFDSLQQNQFQHLRELHQSLQRPLQDSLHFAKDAFYDLLKSDKVTDSVLQVYGNRISTIEQEIDFVRFKHFQSLRAICTAPQQIKFDQIIKEVIQNMQGARGHQGPPPGRRLGPPDGNDGPPEDNRPLPPPDRRN